MSRRFETEYTEREVKYWTAVVFATAYIVGIFTGLFLARVLS